MCKKDMENLDEQVLQVANRSGEDRSAYETAKAERDADNREKIRAAQFAQEQTRAEEKVLAAFKMKRLLKMLAKVLACLVGGALFLALVLEPAFWAPVVGCAGILTFVVAAAICVDRYVQHYKEWWR